MQTQFSRPIAVLAALLLTAVVASPARADGPGDPDPTFGGTGSVTTDVSGSNDRAMALVRQSDGKLVVAGTCTFTSDDFCLARYNSDGTLDATFDGDGKVRTDITASDDEANALVLQSDGKLVAAGRCGVFPNDVFCLARYNADGGLDPGFGTTGIATIDVSGGSDVAFALTIQSDGKLVAAGSCDGKFCIVRYDVNGNLDVLGFGGGTGIVTTSLSGGTDVVRALIVQPDGKLVAGGTCEFATADFCLARYDGSGSPDNTFGIGGSVHTDINSDTNSLFALVRQTDGKLVAAGNCEFATSDFCLARYDSNGTLDSGFGTSGIVHTDVAGDFDAAQALVVQADGKLAAAGICDNPVPDFCLARYNADGTSDTTFGTGGTTLTDVSGDFDSAQAVILQPDGKLVAAGYCDDPADLCVVRYDASVPEKLFSLSVQVNTFSVLPGLREALSAHVAGATVAQARGNVNAACGSLGALVHQLSALVGKQIGVSDVNAGIATALEIRSDLACK